MKILFMGTPSYAQIILEALIEKYDIIGVYTQPDKPVGRKKTLTPPPVKVLAAKYNLNIYQPHNLKSEAQTIKQLNPDFIIVAAFGMILPKEILEIAPCINLHASLLPKYRGASPIQSAILNADKFTGITAMKMDVGLDTGDILGYEYCMVGDKTAPELFEELAIKAASLTPFIIDNYHHISPLKQNNAIASYSPKITKNDGLIDFENAYSIYRKYLAFYFWPGIFTHEFKLKKISLHETTTKHTPREILQIHKDHIIVGCQQGSLKLYTIQPHSKKEMDVISYLNGKKLKVGDLI
ncbi:MAG: methionyl-tRNA formyltransferase [Epsilonproteobacteria bacterium]|nr:methionyl-tRNA formyltransferase [Campylobacterota bacterium]